MANVEIKGRALHALAGWVADYDPEDSSDREIVVHDINVALANGATLAEIAEALKGA